MVVQHAQLVNVLTVQLFLCNFGLDFRVIVVGFHHVQVIVRSRDADSKEKQPDSQNENQAVKDELIAFYGDVKDDLTPDDIDDLMVAMRAKAERNKKKKSGV